MNMFHNFKKLVVKNHEKIYNTLLFGSIGIGSSIGMYHGYKDSRNESYSECILKTTLMTTAGAFGGFLGGFTLPITLPIICSVSVLRWVDTDRRN